MNTDPAAAPKHRARKRFGQHFLTDPYVVAGIVAAISPQREDHLVEIGPGLGVLTESLLPCVNAMDAIELDRDIIPKLKEHCRDRGQLHIHEADALKFDFTTLAEDGRPLRIVGNLPYNISTPLMFHLLSMHKQIQDMHFMLQKEVVDRLAAIPGQQRLRSPECDDAISLPGGIINASTTGSLFTAAQSEFCGSAFSALQ